MSLSERAERRHRIGDFAALLHDVVVRERGCFVPMPRVVERLNLRRRLGAILLGEQDVVRRVRVEWRIEVDEVHGLIGDVTPQDIEVVAVVEGVVGHAVTPGTETFSSHEYRLRVAGWATGVSAGVASPYPVECSAFATLSPGGRKGSAACIATAPTQRAARLPPPGESCRRGRLKGGAPPQLRRASLSAKMDISPPSMR